MQLVHCNFEQHGEAILAILNEAIVSSTALYDYEPRTLDNMRQWFQVKAEKGFPVLGLIDDAGKLLAFSTYGAFRAFAGYQHTVEHSVYVHKEHRGCGYGLRMIHAIIDAAQARGVHVVVGVIDASNGASITMHEKLGFTHSGTLREVGYKFGRWLDIVFYQLNLPLA